MFISTEKEIINKNTVSVEISSMAYDFLLNVFAIKEE